MNRHKQVSEYNGADLRKFYKQEDSARRRKAWIGTFLIVAGVVVFVGLVILGWK